MARSLLLPAVLALLCAAGFGAAEQSPLSVWASGPYLSRAVDEKVRPCDRWPLGVRSSSLGRRRTLLAATSFSRPCRTCTPHKLWRSSSPS